MQILKCGNFRALLVQRVNPARCGVRRRKRRNARNVVANRGAPDRLFVIKRFATERGINDEDRSYLFSRVDDVRNGLHFTLKTGSASMPAGFQRRRGSARGKQAETRAANSFPREARCLLSRSFTLRNTVPCEASRCPAASCALAKACP